MRKEFDDYICIMCACSSLCSILVPFVYDHLSICTYSSDFDTLQEDIEKKTYEKGEIIKDIIIGKDDLEIFRDFLIYHKNRITADYKGNTVNYSHIEFQVSDPYTVTLFIISDLTKEDIEKHHVHRATQLSFDKDGYEKLIKDVEDTLENINSFRNN